MGVPNQEEVRCALDIQRI